MENKTIKGRIFIIPNSPFKKSVEGDESWQRLVENLAPRLKNFGLKVEDNEPMVQVWAANEECDNFSNHYSHYAKMLGEEEVYNKRFPSYLPYSIIKDLKEGETLTLRREDGLVIELVADQLNTRYRRFGKFEECLSDLV